VSKTRLGFAMLKTNRVNWVRKSFVSLDRCLNMIWRFWRCDPVKTGRSLMGLSHDLAGYGLARENILAALRIKVLP
jgi:hypothetical protein